MNGSPKSVLNVLCACRGICLRFPSILLLISAVPLVAILSLHAPVQASAYNPDCQSSMQNAYPSNVVSGQEIVITTTVTNVCLSTFDYTQIIVSIMLPNTTVILSSAVAAPVAVNKIRAPEVGGPWTLDVVVSFNDYPLGGTLSSFQNAIIINVAGPVASSIIKSSTVSTPIVASTSTVEITKSVTSTPVVVSLTKPPQLRSTSTASTTSTSTSTSLTPLGVQYLWQGWNGLIILASIIAILLGVVVVRIRGRRSE